MTDKQFSQLITKLTNCEIALYQIDQMIVFLLSVLLAGVVLYFIWYCLIRFTWF